MKKGKAASNWRGGVRSHSEGYVLVYRPKHPAAINDCVYEHRLVVEKMIGRHLRPHETVHHRGRKSDNRPKMLMAFSRKDAHNRFHKNPRSVKPSEIIFDGRKI